jgi:hypothetical protein
MKYFSNSFGVELISTLRILSPTVDLKSKIGKKYAIV